jgi:hypothetical protein
MSLLDKTRMIERLQFFDGMRLFGDDLQGLEAFNREMRWLHNSSLHQPGIGNGFAVSGKRGDREVTIGAGYAIDKYGREIVLLQERREPVPPVAGDPRDGSPVVYDLVVSYPADEILEEVETRAGICDSRGVTRLREEPLFCWVKYRRSEITNQYGAEDPGLAADIESGIRLVLTRVEVQNCQLKKDVSLAERRNARPASTPLIACDDFKPTPWRPYWLLDRGDLIGALAEIFDMVIKELLTPTPTPEGIPEARNVRRARTGRARFRAFFTPTAASLQSLMLFAPIVLPLGIQAPVPTVLGGVREIPSYFTRISGRRIVELDLLSAVERLGLIDRTLLDDENRRQLEEFPHVRVFVEGLPTVVNPRTSIFTFQAPMLIQLLQDLDLEELSRLRALVAEHVQGQIQKHPIYLKLQECAKLKDKEGELKTCLEEAAEMTLQIIEDVFIQSVVPADWQVIWMGVEE